MATIPTANNNSALNSSRRSYVAVKPFKTDFYSYTVAMNSSYVNEGTLTQVTDDHGLAPKGRVLRENGRKLYPGANPGVTKYLVGVYDSETSLSGFIDPNSPTFTIFNSDRPNYMPVEDEVDIGAPVYTAGSVEAGTTLTVGGATTLNGDVTVNASLTVNENVGGTYLKNANTVTGGSYVPGTGIYSYTVTHNYAVGQRVIITGLVSTGGTNTSVMNTSGLVASITGTTAFTIAGATGLNGGSVSAAWASGGTINLLVGSGSTVVTITSATYTSATGVLVYNGVNTFAAGQTVVVSGVSISSGNGPFNITGVVESATSTSFTINGVAGLGTSTATANTGTATLLVESVNAGNTARATVTAATYSAGSPNIYTYTATNTFVPGQSVSITGVVSTGVVGGYNISGVIINATSAVFTISGPSATGINNPTGQTALAVATQQSLVVTSENTTVRGGLVLPDTALYVKLNRITGRADMADGGIVGGLRRLTVNTAACTSASYVFLTNADLNNYGTVYSVETITNGSFEIVSNNTADNSKIMWFIVNSY